MHLKVRIGYTLLAKKDFISHIIKSDGSIDWLIKRFLVICLHNFVNKDTGYIAVTCLQEFLQANNFTYLNNKGTYFIYTYSYIY